LLAENIGMPFKTPEEFFRDESPQPFSIALDLNKFDGQYLKLVFSILTITIKRVVISFIYNVDFVTE